MEGRIRLAVIGGTGVYDPALLAEVREKKVATPYGEVEVILGRLPFTGEEVAFLPRHGRRHSLPPHRINYRANLWALRELGVERILATAAVGSLREEVRPESIFIPDQFLDFTRSRPSTFFEGEERGVAHADMTEPYCSQLRRVVKEAAEGLGVGIREGGVYVCTEGPRFETPAEIRMFSALGGDVVGMTGVPEVVLARELSLCYATLAVVTNYAAGISPQPLTHREVLEAMERGRGSLRALLARALSAIPRERSCDCGRPLEVFGA